VITLYDLKLGDIGVVRKIHTSNRELRERLISFGIVQGAEVEIRNCNINKQNIEILVSDTLIALRKEEAQTIEVEKIGNGKED